MAEIRQLPHSGHRIETGPLKIGHDAPGVFLRREHALYYGTLLRQAIKNSEGLDPMTVGMLRGLRDLLCSGDTTGLCLPELPPSEPNDGSPKP